MFLASKLTREQQHWAETKSAKWNRRTIAAFAAVLIATVHDTLDFQQLADWARLIVGTRNVMAKNKVTVGKVWKACALEAADINFVVQAERRPREQHRFWDGFRLAFRGG